MSIFTKTLVAAGLTLALAGGAYASDATDYTLKANQGYVVDMTGRSMIVTIKAPTKEIMARAKEVARGTVIFSVDGKLMMVVDPAFADQMSH